MLDWGFFEHQPTGKWLIHLLTRVNDYAFTLYYYKGWNQNGNQYIKTWLNKFKSISNKDIPQQRPIINNTKYVKCRFWAVFRHFCRLSQQKTGNECYGIRKESFTTCQRQMYHQSKALSQQTVAEWKNFYYVTVVFYKNRARNIRQLVQFLCWTDLTLQSFHGRADGHRKQQKCTRYSQARLEAIGLINPAR